MPDDIVPQRCGACRCRPSPPDYRQPTEGSLSGPWAPQRGCRSHQDMNKQLSIALSDRTGLSQVKSMEVLNALFDSRPGSEGIIPAALSSERVVIPGFGTFGTKVRASPGHQPRTPTRRSRSPRGSSPSSSRASSGGRSARRTRVSAGAPHVVLALTCLRPDLGAACGATAAPSQSRLLSTMRPRVRSGNRPGGEEEALAQPAWALSRKPGQAPDQEDRRAAPPRCRRPSP